MKKKSQQRIARAEAVTESSPTRHFDSASKIHTTKITHGVPLQLSIDLIDEDPDQPRSSNNPGFSSQSLEELAATIRLRGIKTPISVRHHTAMPGRFLINHGARRYRGSLLAGRSCIPAFIDDDYTDADQVIENLQRNSLTPREIADYIGRELSKGKKKSEIARIIGKSAAFVTQHVTLLDLPDPICAAFTCGRVRDVTLVNELVMAFKKMPREVQAWLVNESQEITRGTVKLLRDFLDEKRISGLTSTDYVDDVSDQDDSALAGVNTGSVSKGPDRLRSTVLAVRYKRRPARMLLNRRPTRDGLAWLKYDDDGQELEADLTHVKLVALREG